MENSPFSINPSSKLLVEVTAPEKNEEIFGSFHGVHGYCSLFHVIVSVVVIFHLFFFLLTSVLPRPIVRYLVCNKGYFFAFRSFNHATNTFMIVPRIWAILQRCVSERCADLVLCYPSGWHGQCVRSARAAIITARSYGRPGLTLRTRTPALWRPDLSHTFVWMEPSGVWTGAGINASSMGLGVNLTMFSCK